MPPFTETAERIQRLPPVLLSKGHRHDPEVAKKRSRRACGSIPRRAARTIPASVRVGVPIPMLSADLSLPTSSS